MAQAEKPRNIVVAMESFVGGIGTKDYRVVRGDLYEDGDPVVKAWPDKFAPITVRKSVGTPRIEQATAAPGEQRGA
jgi:hypothetical protein